MNNEMYQNTTFFDFDPPQKKKKPLLMQIR